MTALDGGRKGEMLAADAPTFIETQFPVSRLSKESYKERKANYSQTLTGLGKWWGRKPLVMVRAILLGLLVPASDDPRKDREVFLALLTMDEEGLWRRKSRNVPLKEVYWRLSPEEQAKWFARDSDPDRPRLKKGTKAADRARLQRIVFDRMGYDEKLKFCGRPEHLDGPSPDAWKAINRHLGTSAASLPELVRALGERRFGRAPRVGDAFCGGGSVPFEAARLGCEAYGSDLNPVAALLTWGALNIVGGGEEVAERVRAAQTDVFEAVNRQVTAWRIEHDEAGWRADAFLYCTETACPECGWRVPLAPSWVIGEKTRAVARLRPEPAERRFAIDVRSGVGREALAAARSAGTVRQSRLECPNPGCRASTPMTAIRGDRRGDGGRGHGLRQWENDDLAPRPDDVFQERLYCVRWRLPSLAALLWAEQRARAAGRLQEDADGMPVPRTGTPVPGHMDSRLRGNDEGGGTPVSRSGAPTPAALRLDAPAGGAAAIPEAARRDIDPGEAPAPRRRAPIPERMDPHFRGASPQLEQGSDGAEVAGMTKAGGASVSEQDTPAPEGSRQEASAGGVAAEQEGTRRDFHAGETPAFPGSGPSPAGGTSAFPETSSTRHSRESGNPGTPVLRRGAPIPGASGMPEVARQDVRAGETPAFPGGLRRDVDAEGPSAAPDAPPPPVPEWVDLECAIAALVGRLEAGEQREVAELRERDWLAEDREVEEAQREYEAKRNADRPKRELTAVAQRLRNAREAADRRNDRVEALAKSLPAALYRAVDDADLEREAQALALLRERFPDWQALGYVPSRAITPGDETARLMRERGWTHWHHLFNARQLLLAGTFTYSLSENRKFSGNQKRALLLVLARCLNFNSRLTRWVDNAANEKGADTFANQALNTLWVYVTRPWPRMGTIVQYVPKSSKVHDKTCARSGDARENLREADLWVTDPPYADAVNYHELSEFFLAWHEKPMQDLFPDWHTDSKRALAVRGADADFRRSMVDCYRNLAAHMPDNGLQVVMFTHQDASVWADLALILWAAGLRVTAAWTIATETESALKEGNYVQGTVLMVLRKQTTGETAFLDEVVPEVDAEVKRQLDSMLDLDDREDPNFSDADYQLAAYAAALRVLTRYGSIEDLDLSHELSRERRRGEPNPIEKIIGDAVRTASNHLVPEGLPDHLWPRLTPKEKLYVKGLDVERHGDFRSGVYQEFARGFGVRDYRDLLHTGKANRTRLKTASEFGRRDLGDSAFGRSLVRHALYAVWRAAESGEVADSLTWLRAELPGYWPQREALAAVLRYLAALDADHWREDAAAARLVAGAVENDHV